MKAIILAAGASTRTYPLTLTRPKPLLPFLNKTIIEYMLDVLRDMGNITDVILVVNYKKEMIKDTLGDSYKGMKISYAFQDEPKGTGHGVYCARDYITNQDGSLLIINGDDIYSREDIARLIENKNSVLVKEVENPSLFGIFETRVKDGKLIARTLEEKPRSPRSCLANVGAYHFSIDIFKYIGKIKPSRRGELEFTDALRMYMDWHDIELVKVQEYWLPIGYPWDLLSATEKLLDSPVISEKTNIDDSVIISDKTMIDSQVQIGKDSIIENSLIFKGARIGKGCVIKNSIIGENVKIEDHFETMDEAEELFSDVKGTRVDIERDKFGCVIGDNSQLRKEITTLPGVKVWPNITVYNTKSINNDIKE